MTSQQSRSLSLSQSILQGSNETPTVSKVEAGNRTCSSAGIGAPNAPPAAQARKLGRADRPPSRPHQGSTCASTGLPLPGSLRGSGRAVGGQRGGARSCRRPPGPVGTRGGMFLPLPGPPSACRPVHPGVAECKARGPGEGALSTGRRRPPHLLAHQGSVSFWEQKGPRLDPACAGLAHITHPGTRGPLSTGSPSSLPGRTPHLGTRWAEATSRVSPDRAKRVADSFLTLSAHAPSPSRADTPGRPARTDSHPAPHLLPSTSAQECRGRLRPARADALLPPLD